MEEEEFIGLDQQVAILCDGNNIEKSIHQVSGSERTMLNFDLYIPKILAGRNLKRLIYFREGRNISEKLANRLNGKFYGSVYPCYKAANVALTIKATQLKDKVDTILILSGDSDYIELLRYLKSEGLRVEIGGMEGSTAGVLKRESDYFHPIEEDDWFELAPMTPPEIYDPRLEPIEE